MKYVYLLQAGECYYKVGVSDDVNNRLRSIQTSNHVRVRIVAFRHLESAIEVERDIHKWLKDFRARGGQEWFILEPVQALELIIRITNSNDLRVMSYVNLYTLPEELELVEQSFLRTSQKVMAVAKRSKPTVEKVLLPPAIKPERFSDEDTIRAATEEVVGAGKASASLLQRRLKIGYARAARILDELEKRGIVGPLNGAKARTILVTRSTP